MIWPLSPQTYAGSVIEPEPSPLRLFRGDLQPLVAPDAFDPLVIDDPARGRSQKLPDLPPLSVYKQTPTGQGIAEPGIFAGKFEDISDQPFFIISPRRRPPLRRSMLSEHTANPAFGQF